MRYQDIEIGEEYAFYNDRRPVIKRRDSADSRERGNTYVIDSSHWDNSLRGTVTAVTLGDYRGAPRTVAITVKGCSDHGDQCPGYGSRMEIGHKAEVPTINIVCKWREQDEYNLIQQKTAMVRYKRIELNDWIREYRREDNCRRVAQFLDLSRDRWGQWSRYEVIEALDAMIPQLQAYLLNGDD